MRGFNIKRKDIFPVCLFQPLAGAFLIGLLMLFSEVLSLPMIVSLGATTFIVVTMPHATSTHARHLIGGYFCGIVAGLIAWEFRQIAFGVPVTLVAVLAVALAAIAMVLGNFNHPPACALALSLVLSSHPFVESALAFSCIMLVSLALHFMRPYMKNLY